MKERVVVYDGAMGTNIQKRNPTLDDYWGKENCSEVLVLSRPDIIRDIHAEFFAVGCDVVETDTFGGTSMVLGEFGFAGSRAGNQSRSGETGEGSGAAVLDPGLAPLCRGLDGSDHQAAVTGPHQFDDMAAAYEEQALALIEGGVDILLIETAQDLLQAKVRPRACWKRWGKLGSACRCRCR